MAKERAQKKTYQQSLEDIKERMKGKRNKRLARALAPSRGRSKMINKSSVVNSSHAILKSIQQNNKELAFALQVEKEKGRQANAVILQLKREQHALFLHLLLLKKKLKEQEALAANAAEIKTPNIPVESEHHVDMSRKQQTSQNNDEPIAKCQASPVCADPQPPGNQVVLPSTVGVRRRYIDRRSRRRSERVQEKRLLSEAEPSSGFIACVASPICDDGDQPPPGAEPDLADPVATEEFQHATPEPQPVPPKNNNPCRKKAQQQPRTKPEPAQKAERGRKPDRAPLKKPWENPKPRARSKSRDRSATRAKAAPPSLHLNTSLGFNDTFDFDCEGAVHITPFKAKADDSHVASSTPVGETQTPQTEASPAVSKQSSSSSSSESDDSLYVPQKNKRALASPQETKVIHTRRGRVSRVVKQKENVPPKQEIFVFRDEESSPKNAEPEKGEVQDSPECSYPAASQENHEEPQREIIDKDCLPPVSPLVEVEMMRIDTVLSNFGDSSGEAPLLTHQTPQRVKTSKKRRLGVRTAGRGMSLCDVTNMSPAAYCKFPRGGSRPSDAARCSTPVPARKRRCTMAVDYKEPTLNAKLRRGDKFTDLQFLSSPIFKQKSGRRSGQKSMSNQPPFKKYNESFVGCR